MSEQQKSLYWLYNIYITESLCSMFVFFTSCDSSSLLCCIIMFLQLVWSFRTNSLKTHFLTLPSFSFIIINIQYCIWIYHCRILSFQSFYYLKFPPVCHFHPIFLFVLLISKIEIVNFIATTILWHFHLKLLTETVASFVNSYTEFK